MNNIKETLETAKKYANRSNDIISDAVVLVIGVCEEILNYLPINEKQDGQEDNDSTQTDKTSKDASMESFNVALAVKTLQSLPEPENYLDTLLRAAWDDGYKAGKEGQ